jgi:hypothetical protein
MKTTELFVEQTLTGFLVLAAGAAPFLSWEKLEKLPGEAKGGIDISSAAGAIGVAYLLGVVFDRFADTLLERINRWNRLLFAIGLKKENKALSPDDPFPEDRLPSARAKMRVAMEPAFWLGVFLLALGLGLIAVGPGPDRARMAGVLGTGAVLTAISVWGWWRTTETFMQFLADFRRLVPPKVPPK